MKLGFGCVNCFIDMIQKACALQSNRPGFTSFVVLDKLIFPKSISSSEKKG